MPSSGIRYGQNIYIFLISLLVSKKKLIHRTNVFLTTLYNYRKNRYIRVYLHFFTRGMNFPFMFCVLIYYIGYSTYLYFGRRNTSFANQSPHRMKTQKYSSKSQESPNTKSSLTVLKTSLSNKFRPKFSTKKIKY